MNKDLISRSRLINELKRTHRYPKWLAMVIESGPSEDAELIVHAHWENERCSKCGALRPTDTMLDFLSEEENEYCYSCGSLMDEEAT